MQRSNSLKEIVNNSNSKNSKIREKAWRQFLSKYKNYIYKVVLTRCNHWDVARLGMQQSEVVNDVVSEVFLKLVKSLHLYRDTDNDKKFLFWLAQVCNNCASKYIQKQFTHYLTNQEIGNAKDFLGIFDLENKWEIYEETVSIMRNQKSNWTRNMERDIFIFQQYLFEDFSKEMMLSQPCLNKLGKRVIDNVLNRMRKIFTKNKIV